VGLPLFACRQPTPRKAAHPRLPVVTAAGDLSGDGRLDDHFTDHTSIYVGNGSIVHAPTTTSTRWSWRRCGTSTFLGAARVSGYAEKTAQGHPVG